MILKLFKLKNPQFLGRTPPFGGRSALLRVFRHLGGARDRGWSPGAAPKRRRSRVLPHAQRSETTVPSAAVHQDRRLLDDRRELAGDDRDVPRPRRAAEEQVAVDGVGQALLHHVPRQHLLGVHVGGLRREVLERRQGQALVVAHDARVADAPQQLAEERVVDLADERPVAAVVADAVQGGHDLGALLGVQLRTDVDTVRAEAAGRGDAAAEALPAERLAGQHDALLGDAVTEQGVGGHVEERGHVAVVEHVGRVERRTGLAGQVLRLHLLAVEPAHEHDVLDGGEPVDQRAVHQGVRHQGGDVLLGVEELVEDDLVVRGTERRLEAPRVVVVGVAVGRPAVVADDPGERDAVRRDLPRVDVAQGLGHEPVVGDAVEDGGGPGAEDLGGVERGAGVAAEDAHLLECPFRRLL